LAILTAEKKEPGEAIFLLAKCFCKKVREYAKLKAKQEERILLEFPVDSLYYIMEFMSRTEGKPLATLTKLAVLLLQPPAPFENKTIQPSELVE